MDTFPDKHTTIKEFSLRAGTSEFTPDLLPLLGAEPKSLNLQRISDGPEYLQMLWQRELEQDAAFAQLCLTLSKKTLSLTVATNFNSENKAESTTRSSLVIEGISHTLHTTNKYSAFSLARVYGEDAVAQFRPVLDHTFTRLGLNQSEEALRQESEEVPQEYRMAS